VNRDLRLGQGRLSNLRAGRCVVLCSHCSTS
jgi:hypothetical protein